MNGLNNHIRPIQQTLPLDLLVCIGRFLDIQTRQNFLLSCKALYNRRASVLFDPKASKFGGTMKDFLLIIHEYGCKKVLTSLRSLTFYRIRQYKHKYYLSALVCDLNAIKSFVVNKLIFKNSDIQNINIFFKINNLITLDVSGIKKIKFMHDVENIKKPMTFIYQLNTIESSCIESLESNANITVVKKGKNNTQKSRRIIIFTIMMFLFLIVQG